MKKYLLIRFSVFISFILVLFSCTSELGWSDNNNLEPFFEIKDIFNENIPLGTPSPLIIPFQILDNTTVKKNLKKVVFHVTITNNTSNSIVVGLDFLDNNNLPLKTVYLSINSNESIEQNIFFESPQEIENVKKINQLKITFPTFTSGNITATSGATVYLKL